MKEYVVKKFSANDHTLIFEVPSSKSIINRALILAATANGDVLLRCGAYGEDTRALLQCLNSLGICFEKQADGILVHGCGGNIPKRNTTLDVMSAGTAARFLTILLAVCGGTYRFRSSPQMQRRPMNHLKLLEQHGVQIKYENEPYHFPFTMQSNGILDDDFTIDTDESTQYASGMLLAASVRPSTIRLTGGRTNGSYIHITLSVMQDFGIPFARSGANITVSRPDKTPKEFVAEPDLSAACYFYALSLLFGCKVVVRGVEEKSVQGDFAFLHLLRKRGVRLQETPEGLLADGSQVKDFAGFDEDVQDFSDQTLTLAALAPFATSSTVLRNVSHIRAQECDRISAICENLTTLGVPANTDGKNIYIAPAPITGGTVRAFGDHRVAMSFALIGLKTGNVTIDDPDCCKKTFENYFEILTRLTK